MGPRIGILGGRQLGKMLHTAGAQMDMDLHFMDKDETYPVAKVSSQYTCGDLTKYQDVLDFGKDKDVMTVEIEKVNTEALFELEEKGVKVYPQPHLLQLIQDKGLQKQFYIDNEIPTSRFELFENINQLRAAINEGRFSYPFVQKTRKDGYDGKGVKLIKSGKDMATAFQSDFLVEEMVNIDKEIAVICCQSPSGKMIVYDAVEMVFHPTANVLLYQLTPTTVHPKYIENAKRIAMSLTRSLEIVGLLAIEMFVTKDGEIVVNEVAPRPHNSGHHTIECCYVSQYENHLRAISDLPLGCTDLLTNSLLMNVLGADNYQGPVHYKGLKKILEIKGVNLHLYGKDITKPFRKMGHINIIGESKDELIKAHQFINSNFRAITKV